MITYCEKCESNIDTDKPCKHVIYQKPITITTPATKPLDEQIDSLLIGFANDWLAYADRANKNGSPILFIHKYVAKRKRQFQALITNAEKQARIDTAKRIERECAINDRNFDTYLQELENL